MARQLASVLTLGCKLNLADSEEIAAGLRGVGFAVVEQLCDADLYVINTCSVTHTADRKSRKLIRSIRRMAPRAAVTVTGCFPQSAGFEAVRELGADFVTGMRDADKAALIEFAASAAGERASGARGGPAEARQALTRAFIKAQEGCNDVCAFCIVPRTRGREVSRGVERVVADVKAAVESGAREVVITGTQLGAWGRDFERPLRPDALIGAILEQTEVPRLRFSSLQPQDITPELLALWGDPRLMPHFHLALQSGSDATLTAMRRRYTATEFLLAAERIRAAVPDVAITTDVIAGFPGETEADFQATLDLCRAAGFSRMHAFPYSVRSKTSAARFGGQLAPDVIKERMARLLSLGEELSLMFRRSLAGTIRPVLWESPRPSPDGQLLAIGHTDNYLTVYADARHSANRITPVQLGPVYHDGVWGSVPGEAL
jgi:threonylcarbamoyladenosine tRNA methylthiotransferase MtaB